MHAVAAFSVSFRIGQAFAGWEGAFSRGVGVFGLVGGRPQSSLFAGHQERLDSVCRGLVQLERLRLVMQQEGFNPGLAAVNLLLSPAVRRLVWPGLGYLNCLGF